MTDYRLTFPVTALANGVRGITALRAELQSDTNATPINALGDPRDANGDIVVHDPNAPIGTPPPEVWHGRPGSAATSYTDLNGNVVQVPAKGDPALYYVHIRSAMQAGEFDPTEHGMSDADVIASAANAGHLAGRHAAVSKPRPYGLGPYGTGLYERYKDWMKPIPPETGAWTPPAWL